MIFKDTWEAVIAGMKPVTRRLKRPGEFLKVDTVFTKRHSIKYQVGREYAIQKNYREKAVGKFRITRIREEALQEISGRDCMAELGWIPVAYGESAARDAFKALWNGLHKKGDRWEDNLAVWVLNFELVEPEGGFGMSFH